MKLCISFKILFKAEPLSFLGPFRPRKDSKLAQKPSHCLTGCLALLIKKRKSEEMAGNYQNYQSFRNKYLLSLFSFLFLSLFLSLLPFLFFV